MDLAWRQQSKLDRQDRQTFESSIRHRSVFGQFKVRFACQSHPLWQFPRLDAISGRSKKVETRAYSSETMNSPSEVTRNPSGSSAIPRSKRASGTSFREPSNGLPIYRAACHRARTVPTTRGRVLRFNIDLEFNTLDSARITCCPIYRSSVGKNPIPIVSPRVFNGREPPYLISPCAFFELSRYFGLVARRSRIVPIATNSTSFETESRAASNRLTSRRRRQQHESNEEQRILRTEHMANQAGRSLRNEKNLKIVHFQSYRQAASVFFP